MQFDMFRVEMFRLMNQGNVFLHQMAADRIVARAELWRADREARPVMLEVMETWIKSFNAMRTMVDQVGKELLPQVLKAQKEWNEGPPPDNFCPECEQRGGAERGKQAEPTSNDQGDEDDEDDDEDAEPDPGKPRHHKPVEGGPLPVRPSHVIAPGEWDEWSIRACKMLEDEESLRIMCVYGPHLDEKGRPPLKPLVVIDGAEVLGYGLRRTYAQQNFPRPWADPQGWNIDGAMIEDYLLLLALLESELCTRDRDARVVRLLPFLRCVDIDALPWITKSTVARLLCVGWLVLRGDDRWSIPTKRRIDLEPLRMVWATAHSA